MGEKGLPVVLTKTREGTLKVWDVLNSIFRLNIIMMYSPYFQREITLNIAYMISVSGVLVSSFQRLLQAVADVA